VTNRRPGHTQQPGQLSLAASLGNDGGQVRLQLISSLGVTLATFNTMVNISGLAGNTVITIGTDTITLLGVNSANVDANDFLFGP
jgi:hypothetical protein